MTSNDDNMSEPASSAAASEQPQQPSASAAARQEQQQPAQQPATGGSIASSAKSSSTATRRLHHGRGPLIRDSDDSDDDLSDDTGDEESALLRRARGDDGAWDSDDTEGARSAFLAGDLSRRLKKRRARKSKRGKKRTRPPCGCLGICAAVTGALLGLALLCVAIVHVWLGHVIGDEMSDLDLDIVAQRGLEWTGPTAVSLSRGPRNTSTTTVEHDDDAADVDMWIHMNATVGFDVRNALGWQRKDAHGAGWLKRVEAAVARWGTTQVDRVSVSVGEVLMHDSKSASADGDALVAVRAINPVVVPVSYPKPRDGVRDVHTSNVAFDIPLKLLDPHGLQQLALQAWHGKRLDVTLNVSSVAVSLARPNVGRPWTWLGRFSAVDIAHSISFKLPDLGGGGFDPADFVELLNYTVWHSQDNDGQDEIALHADARASNPVRALLPSTGPVPRDFAYRMPWHLPVIVSLPAPPENKSRDDSSSGESEAKAIPFARARVSPFGFPHGARHAQITIDGQLVSADSIAGGGDEGADQDEASKALSLFLASYVAGRNSTVIAALDADVMRSAMADEVSKDRDDDGMAPAVLADLLQGINFALEFPGANDSTDLFKKLEIQDMSIRLPSLSLSSWMQSSSEDDDEDADVLCSGTVVAELNLPHDLNRVQEALNVTAIWPDTIMYDGEPPSSFLTARSEPDQLALGAPAPDAGDEYPPRPMPATAFARLSTSSFINATTKHHTSYKADDGSSDDSGLVRTVVRATFVDAPMRILPGRGDIFRRFVGRLIFSPRARMGVKGVASTKLELAGWGNAKLTGLPVQGSFWVSRNGVES